jgi:hypothetical protein
MGEDLGIVMMDVSKMEIGFMLKKNTITMIHRETGTEICILPGHNKKGHRRLRVLGAVTNVNRAVEAIRGFIKSTRNGGPEKFKGASPPPMDNEICFPPLPLASKEFRS